MESTCFLYIKKTSRPMNECRSVLDINMLNERGEVVKFTLVAVACDFLVHLKLTILLQHSNLYFIPAAPFYHKVTYN